MFKRSLPVILILAAVVLLGGWQTPKLPAPEEIGAILKELSAVTGFKVRKQLPFQMVTRDQVNAFVQERIKKSVKPEEIRAEEITLKKFGFVSEGFDLKQTTIDLLTEQAAAFYDFHKKKLFISDWASTNMREAALIHELGHALADQNFPIEKFLKGGQASSEQSTGREAVVEGQASWLMLEVVARRSGRTLRDPQTAREYLADNDSGAGGEYPVFDKAPLYFKRTLMFPYEDGMRFQQAVFLRDGQPAFARVFRQPPQSTAQVIHPARYFASEPFISPKLPKSIRHARAYSTGTLGELEHSILLEQFLNKETAASLSPKLKGAAYRVDRSRANQGQPERMMLVYASEWTDEQSASEYFDAYRKILRGKWHKQEMIEESATRVSGKSEDGYFQLTVSGTEVLSQEGFPQPL